MPITEVRVKPVEHVSGALRAFASVTFDGGFVVRDIKVIQSARGWFLAMPSRKITSPCPNCSQKCFLGDTYCSRCGDRLPEGRAGGMRLFEDLCFPSNRNFREMLTEMVMAEYWRMVLPQRVMPELTITFADVPLGETCGVELPVPDLPDCVGQD